jgi:DUF4097 and DUF4098 domain-containing protein YvlB
LRRIMSLGGALALAVLAATSWATASRLSEPKTYDFPLGPKGRVELKNLSGNIHVERWDEPRVSVEVVKAGEGRSEEAIRAAFEKWTLDVENRPDFVRIEADLKGPWKSWSRWDDREADVAFDFTAKVPRDAALDISSINGEQIEILGAGDGPVDARNVNGDVHFQGSGEVLDLSTVNGGVTAEIDPLRPDANVKLATVNGAICLYVPEGTGADLGVQSLSGKLYSNLDLPKQTIESFIGFQYHAKLGAGGGRVRLETVHGPVRILRPGSDRKAGESVVTLQPKSIVIPPIPPVDIDGEAIAEAVREATEGAGDAAREGIRAAHEAAREAGQAAREAAREARDAARETAREAREAARQGVRVARDAAREAGRSVHRHWDWDRQDNDSVHLSGTIAGDLQIHDSNSDIRVGEIQGNASLITFAGEIQVKSIGGEGKLLTYGGGIEVGHAAKTLEAETYGGDISIEKADGPLSVKTKGGDIRVESALAGVQAETLGGDIELPAVVGALRAKTNGGEVQARLKSPLREGEIVLESLGGDLGLTMPKGMGASVRVEITVPRYEANEHFLQTNLQGLQRAVENADAGDTRIVYSGTVNGGGASLLLRTRSGEVALREAETP